jgi:hypothetical protein
VTGPSTPVTTEVTPTHHASGTDRTFLELDPHGMPLLRLTWRQDELWLVDRNNHLLNCDHRGMAPLGIYGFDVRGIKYHVREARHGDFRPGTPAELIREPYNPYDSAAVSIRAVGWRAPTGYVNKGKAPTIARLLDQRVNLQAICLRGTGPGILPDKVSVLVATPDLLNHLGRELAGGMPSM